MGEVVALTTMALVVNRRLIKSVTVSAGRAFNCYTAQAHFLGSFKLHSDKTFISRIYYRQ